MLEDSFSGEWGKETGINPVPVLRTANFNEDGTFDYTTPAMRYISANKVSRKAMKRGDIVLEKSGGTPNRPVGIMAYYDSDALALCSNFNHVLRFNAKSSNSRYMFYQLRWLKEQSAFEPYTRKTTGLQNLQMKSFIDIPLKCPDLDTQNERANTLRLIQELIGVQSTCQDRLDQLIKSRFVEMFRDPLVGNAKWPRKTLGDRCRIITGNTPSRKNEKNYGNYIEWCKTDNITESKYLTRAAECLSESGAESGRIVPAGSILMACIAGSLKSIGKVAVADRPVAFNQQINALIPGTDFITNYLLWALKLSKDYLCSDVNMQLKGILNKSTLSEKVFAIPPIDLQRQFSDFVEQVDKSRFA